MHPDPELLEGDLSRLGNALVSAAAELSGDRTVAILRGLRDAATALQLVREKDRLRGIEKRSSQNHFLRLRDGTARSVETSSIHLDTIRDLKQINSLLASIAYPVLEEHGMLGGTRLKIGSEAPEA